MLWLRYWAERSVGCSSGRCGGAGGVGVGVVENSYDARASPDEPWRRGAANAAAVAAAAAAAAAAATATVLAGDGGFESLGGRGGGRGDGPTPPTPPPISVGDVAGDTGLR